MSEDAEVTAIRRRILLISGGAGALVSALIGLLAPHNGAIYRVPDVLRGDIATALSAQGQQGIDIAMDGQRALLRGVVEQEGDIALARRVALTAAGPGGRWAGGVTSVDVTGLSVGAFERPFEWKASRQGGGVAMSGAVPSAAAREQLIAAASEIFPQATVSEELRVAGGAPSADFTALAQTALRAVARLRSGEARIVDQQLVVFGDGDQTAVDAVHAALDAPPAPFRSRITLTVDGVDPEHPELEGLNLADGDAGACETAFERLMANNVINFTPGSDVIQPSSRPVLDSLASVALRCDRFSIEVAGHTDNNGGRDFNMELSRRRADAVAAYLVGQGVARSRLTPRGYGPDRPRASNATEAGQAANRRIEFTVEG
jgi:outer membrane protein OmpA-like peptidoglycan-associated protein